MQAVVGVKKLGKRFGRSFCDGPSGLPARESFFAVACFSFREPASS